MFEITKTTSESDGYGGLIVSVVNSENEEIWNRFDSYNENIDCVCVQSFQKILKQYTLSMKKMVSMQ